MRSVEVEGQPGYAVESCVDHDPAEPLIVPNSSHICPELSRESSIPSGLPMWSLMSIGHALISNGEDRRGLP